MKFTEVFPIVTLVAGYVASLLTEALRDLRARSREEAARLAARRERLDDRRDDFQRQTLFGLQEALQRYARAVGKTHIADLRAFREGRGTVEYGRTLLPEGVSDEEFAANVELLKLIPRIADDRTRELSSAFRSHAGDVGNARSEEAALEALNQSMPELEQLQARVGELLRTDYGAL